RRYSGARCPPASWPRRRRCGPSARTNIRPGRGGRPIRCWIPAGCANASGYTCPTGARAWTASSPNWRPVPDAIPRPRRRRASRREAGHSMLIPVILSGGAGTRLWPVSRRAYPKPFMTLADGGTLLGKTFQRALAVADASAPVLTVTGRDHYFLTRDAYAAQPGSAGRELPFLLEPAGRNTAPALLAAALV